MSFNRPTSDDTEEDLLRFQREFLEGGSTPAVKVVKKRKSGNVTAREHEKFTSENAPENRDVIKMDAEETSEVPKRVKIVTDRESHAQEDVEKNMDAMDTHITTVLSKITERDTTGVSIQFPSLRTNAFPTVFHREKKKKEGDKAPKPRKSIFAQQFGRKDMTEYGSSRHQSQYSKGPNTVEACILNPLPETVPEKHLREIFPSSAILSGAGLSSSTDNLNKSESHKIHEENLQRLSNMSESEVLSEKQKLMKELDPKLIQFLQNRSKTKKISKEELFLGDLAAKTKSENTAVQEESSTDVEMANAVDEIKSPLKGKYLHMDVVEPEKLAWTEMIPQKERKEIKLSLRFDFDGGIIPEDTDIPSHIGLHHHGENPDQAGYTLQELFTLSRSNFTQQRVFAITLIGKIITKAKVGHYLDATSEPVLDSMLQSGLLFLLRWSLDEQSETLLQASVFALRSLLCSRHADATFDLLFLSDRGCDTPSLSPAVQIKSDDSDYDVAQKDIIHGLLKMKLLERIRYILEICQPGVVVVKHCLEILTRVARHSLQSAVAIYDCPRLMNFVIRNLILVGSDSSDKRTSLYDTPFPKAVLLLRTICIAGRNVTLRMLNDLKDVKTMIFKYIGGSQDENISDENILQTEIEIWKFWIVCASYGLLCDEFRELFPITASCIQSFTAQLSTSDVSLSSISRTQHIFKLCSIILSSSDNTITEWQEICEQIELVSKIVTTKLVQTGEGKEMVELKSVLQISMQFLSGYCEKLTKKENYDIANVTSYSEKLSLCLLDDFSKSLHKCSFREKFHAVRPEGVASLPELTLFSDFEFIADFQFLSSYLHCCVSVCKSNKNLCAKFVPLLEHMARNYSWMTSTGEHLSSFVLRNRTYCLYWAINLYTVLISVCQSDITHVAGFYFLSAFRCFGQLSVSDEHLMHHLLSNVLFHPDILKSMTSATHAVTETMASLDMSKNISEIAPDAGTIIQAALASLPCIRATYLASMQVNSRVLSDSKSRFLHKTKDVAGYMLRPGSDSSLTPSDWTFIPLLQLYDRSISGELPGGSLTHISNCLHYLCMLEQNSKHCLASVSTTAKITRLMCVFLAGNDIFLEPPVKRCLSFLFSHYCNVKSREELDFSKPIAGISSFYDFYLSLLEQYEGVSYGDELFTAVVMLPLHQVNGGIPDIKKAIWSERRDVLRILALPISKLLIPLSWCLNPIEQDSSMVKCYVSALATGYCSPVRNPVLYSMAIHHTSGFLFDKQVDAPVMQRKEIYRGVMKIKQDSIKKHILNYVGLDKNPESKSGFLFSDEMQESRKNDVNFLKQ